MWWVRVSHFVTCMYFIYPHRCARTSYTYTSAYTCHARINNPFICERLLMMMSHSSSLHIVLWKTVHCTLTMDMRDVFEWKIHIFGRRRRCWRDSVGRLGNCFSSHHRSFYHISMWHCSHVCFMITAQQSVVPFTSEIGMSKGGVQRNSILKFTSSGLRIYFPTKLKSWW